MRLARYSMLLALVAAASAHSVAQAATVQDQFEVRVTIEPTCTVTAGTASDIDLGSQPATGTDVTGSNTISVTCSDTTPYTVGLEPSNAATDGAGVMTGTTGDEVPYRLYSATDVIWGNTAVVGDPGNGVAGTGTGSPVTQQVTAIAPSMNFTPGDYADTVTVYVNY